MKRIVLGIVMLAGLTSHSQEVKYFGGIYGNTAYFNFALQNHDTGSYAVETSCDSSDYEEVMRKNFSPTPCVVMYGVQFPACREVKVRVKRYAKDTTVFESELFTDSKYTYVIKRRDK